MTAAAIRDDAMPMLLQWSETTGCGATIKLDNGDIVYISVTSGSVTVRQWDLSGLLQAVRSRFFGPKLYKEGKARRNDRMAEALRAIYPEQAAVLPSFKDPWLSAFANAVWHCRSAAEVAALLRQAAAKLPDEN